ncbi:hypothetical protein SAMN06295937_1007172 [Sphingopyxis flava]|uniref:Phage integrase, N-terminal SAM-like domain n=1 Tax=Sphingopyxis flava TaxID=1507287 RepID=A0A1T5BUZ7_9SPHN|nr:hypothetical protein SAMN06295937_1007172 [Sphingopyxis flava]
MLIWAQAGRSGPESGPFGDRPIFYVDWLRQRGYIRVVCHRALSLARDFPIWFDATRASRGDIREELVTGYLAERSRHRPRYRGDSLAVARSLSVRETNAIAPAADTPRDPREDIFQAYSLYMERVRGLAPTCIASHIGFLRPFLRELRIAPSSAGYSPAFWRKPSSHSRDTVSTMSRKRVTAARIACRSSPSMAYAAE